jgi:hypothetical protein
MPLQGTYNTIIWGDGDGNWEGTLEINFPPQPASVHAAIYQIVHNPGRAAVGVRSIQYRDTPSGPNKTKSFTSHYWNWQPYWFHPLMTQVTFGVSVNDCLCRGWVGIDFWG